jgi:hypothetical protein
MWIMTTEHEWLYELAKHLGAKRDDSTKDLAALLAGAGVDPKAPPKDKAGAP